MIYVALALVALNAALLVMLYCTDKDWDERFTRVLDISASEREMLLERIQAPERVVAPATDESDAPVAVDLDDDEDYWKAREQREQNLAPTDFLVDSTGLRIGS